MIRLENVTKAFVQNGVRTVVADNISFKFPKGRSVAVLGRNGAGKSTLVEMVAGTQDPDSGRIIRRGSVSWPVGLKASFHKDLTGAQNIRFLARVYGVDTDAYVDFVRQFSDLGKHFFLPVRNYSSGMKSRLAFGASMGIQFDTYLVDEVSAVGDAAFKEKSAEIFAARMSQSGAVVVTHSMGMVRNFCNAVAILKNGRLTYYDDVEDGIAAHKENMRRRAKRRNNG
ncbi:MAG: ABC transporter ATP-binding protein [Pseudomonadota bacterium]